VMAQVVAEERVQLLDPEPLYLRRPDAAAPGKPKTVS
jgi:tRNA threonylcarbamoyladenosine biosynthesis protein TsaB